MTFTLAGHAGDGNFHIIPLMDFTNPDTGKIILELGDKVYDLVMKYPNYFAAAFPICGACNVAAFLAQASPLPLWIFHGSLDNTVSPDPDRELYKLLMDKGAKKVTYTEYPGVKHNSWDNAFMEPGLIPWLLSNKLPKKQASW